VDNITETTKVNILRRVSGH